MISRQIRFLVISLCVFLCSAKAFPENISPQEFKSSAKASVSEPELLMGKTMPLTVTVSLPNDSAIVEFPILKEAARKNLKYVPLLNDSVELLVNCRTTLEKQGETMVMRYDMSLQSFDSGTYVLPPFDLTVNGVKVSTNPVKLSVLPVKVKADDKLDDFSNIAEPFDIMPDDVKDSLELEEASNALLWWLIAAAIAVLVLMVFLLIRYRKTGSILLRKPLPPFIVALNKLKKLEQQKLLEKGKTKEYYTRLSDIVRIYLNRQFGIKTLEKTTTEILDSMAALPELAAYEEAVKRIFETSDFVKFAKVNPSETENRMCLETAEKFIENSHPTEEGGKK